MCMCAFTGKSTCVCDNQMCLLKKLGSKCACAYVCVLRRMYLPFFFFFLKLYSPSALFCFVLLFVILPPPLLVFHSFFLSPFFS